MSYINNLDFRKYARTRQFVKRWDKEILRGMAFISVLFVWWLITLVVPPELFPGPTAVGAEIISIVTTWDFYYHLYHTFYRVIIGFILALVLATAIGTWMGINKTAEHYFEFFVLIGLTIPGLAIGMISILVFGLAETAAIIAITATITPMMAENMWAGAKNINTDVIDMAKSFNTSVTRVISEVIFPQMVPYVLAATRFGLGLAWKIVVVVELLGFGQGIGFMITESFQLYSLTGVLAWTLSFTLVMFMLEFGLIKPAERRLTRWQKHDVQTGSLM